MEEKIFVWTSELTKKLFQTRFENDWLFKTKKQPWGEFHKILLQNGFPEEMTINHVRKKWSYTYDTYKAAKKCKNKQWKYYKLFDKHFGKSKTLDKYESWSEGWRLKLITCITEEKNSKIDFQTMWKSVERGLRKQNLPTECCIQDIKGLWQHIRTTFNRKHRLKMKKGAELTQWPVYDAMLNYFQTHEPEYLVNLETQPACEFGSRQRISNKCTKKKTKTEDDNEYENEFHWSKDITETFIQIRLQNDWLFSQKKWAWNDLLSIMVKEYGFPVTLTSRELCRKWAATFSEYQKAKATNNKSWVYYYLFEVYLGEERLSLNPLLNWQEEWVHNLISARTDLDHVFKFSLRDQSGGWREVEKRLRNVGLPLDHSLLDLPEIWTHLLKTFKWKKKFANKGLLNEQWPYYEAMTHYVESTAKPVKSPPRDYDDDFIADEEDEIKLKDLKKRLHPARPTTPIFSSTLGIPPSHGTSSPLLCRACCGNNACVDLYQPDKYGLDLAFKFRTICGIDVIKSDNLPSQICESCLRELENAYNFRIKCQDVNKNFRMDEQVSTIKTEVVENCDSPKQIFTTTEKLEINDMGDVDTHFDDIPDDSEENPAKIEINTIKAKNPKVIRKRKKVRKLKYDYWKVCEVCGKHTRNLVSHLDMHSTGKPYSCDICDKKFKFKSGLVIHKAVHDPNPRKTCEVCGKTFHILAQYRRHFVYHANERKYGCETCGKRFNTQDILKVHNRTHTDERPFSCQECGKTFRTAGCVSRHKRIVHRNVKVQ